MRLFRQGSTGPVRKFSSTVSYPTRILLAVGILLAFSSFAFSANVAVGTCTKLAFYPTISQAISSVPAGSTIRICPGTYPEQLVISKSLSLIGVAGNGNSGPAASGANNPTIVSPAGGLPANTNDLFGFPNGQPTAAQILVQTPSATIGTPIMVNISNLIVDGANNGLSSCATDLVGIYYQNASGTVNHVATRNQELTPDLFGCQDGLAIYVQSGYGSGGTANVTIENSSVHDYDKNGITVDGDGAVATISGNYIVGIGATPLIAQNGIQVSDGATGKISTNVVTDDVYMNPPNCTSDGSNGTPFCFSATGILLYDSGGTSSSHLTINSNTVSNAQGAIVVITDGAETADYNDVTSNKITTSPAAGVFQLDGIDFCSNNNTATLNNVFNSSGSGVHIDGECTEPGGGATGNSTSVTKNTINEACAGVMGNVSGNAVSGNSTYNVLQITQQGDSCPTAGGSAARKNVGRRLKPQARRH